MKIGQATEKKYSSIIWVFLNFALRALRNDEVLPERIPHSGDVHCAQMSVILVIPFRRSSPIAKIDL